MAADLTAYTEEWPPYNYAVDGEVKGVATELLRAICESAKLSCEFKIVPWARAYKVVSETPNTVLYTTARKPSREAEFLWVGPIAPRSTWVYGKQTSKASVHDFKELATKRIGVVRQEASQQDLINAGVPETSLVPQSSNAEVLRMLMAGMVDAMVDTEVGMAWNLRSAGLRQQSVTKLLKLTDDGAYYFALNLHTDPALVQSLQSALDKLRSKGTVAAILRQH